MKNNYALFLDRDGVINYSVIKNKKPFPPLSIKELKIIPEIKEVIQFAKDKEMKVFIVTNQPDVARGLTTKEAIEEINQFIKSNLNIDEIFTCYHDNDDNCKCRKPKPGALLDLSKEYGINLSNSIMIGDRAKDIKAAKNANCVSIFVDYNYDEEKPVDQNYTVKKVGQLLKVLEKHYE